MTKTGVLARASMCVAFLVTTVICVGCPENKPVAVGGDDGHHVNFRGRTCPVGASGDYAIEVVANSNVFKDPADNAIVVCEGDKVSWFIQSGTGVVKVTFTDPYANDLFGQSNFQSHSTSPKSETDKQSVKSQKEHPGRVYKYAIEIEDPAGTLKGKKDPHVIPMGN